MTAVRRLVAAALVASSLSVAPAAFAVDKHADKQFAEARADQAVVYLVREKRFAGSARTMFVYADQTFAGALDNNTYTYAYLPPGKHLLWLNWTKISTEVELEAGKTYYFTVWSTFDRLDEASGKAFIDAVAAYATPTADEVAKGDEHIRERYGKAVSRAEAKPDDASKAFDMKRRAAHVESWPKADLAAYPTLCVEPFTLADPNADRIRKQYLVDTAPQRIADLVLEELGTTAFTTVRRDADCGNTAGTVVLRARITEYQPGSETGRMMLAGVGSAKLRMSVDVVDAASGTALARFDPKGLWAWGGALGTMKGVSDLEKNVAYEIAAYLKVARGQPLPE
jgi:hypothetical protein